MDIDWLGYAELIDTFTFREKASISIPKRVRERAFSLQVDVEIVSTDGRDYANAKSAPAYGFFGYAVLVFRNYASIQIPIAQPRQCLYYERIEDAYVNWYQFYLWRNAREFSRAQAYLLGQIGESIGLGEYVVPPSECVQWAGFEEVPLREVYVKCRVGTQFRLEVSRWEARYELTTDGCPSVPKSNQEDDVESDGTGRDDGLPPLGVQPQQSPDSTDPYYGFPPISTNNELGEYGNNKINGIDFPNPDNNPLIPQVAFYLTWQFRTFDNNCNPIVGYANASYVAGFAGEITITLGQSASRTCDTDLYYQRITIAGVIVDERAGGGNSCYEIFAISIVPS